MVAHSIAKNAMKSFMDLFWLEEVPLFAASLVKADMHCLLLEPVVAPWPEEDPTPSGHGGADSSKFASMENRTEKEKEEEEEEEEERRICRPGRDERRMKEEEETCL
ncbi:hypothetical protein LWI28_008441 [Acer negundo]|uniref:Uncharacterized protein n=1 Tax=Acer negundo TaxID=4023 RepID=A0AAD5I635_ACENE|nr:hypothetical protein LWI28_008441 [Acer negundo]